jgi:ABC-type anion transport system duplicated permease subunit
MENGNLKAIENINYDQVTVLKSVPLIDFVLSVVAFFMPF